MSHPSLPYPASIASLVALAALIVVQVAVATAAARRAGQVPGMPLTAGHPSFAFRAHRAHQNTLENAPAFAVALVAAMVAGAAALAVETAAVAFVAARLTHAGAYYAGVARLRTAAFGAGLLTIVALIAATVAALV